MQPLHGISPRASTQRATSAGMLEARPEMEVLLCCAKSYSGRDVSGRIRALLGEQIQWERLLKTACRHGMLPCLYKTLNTGCLEARSADQLRAGFHARALENHLLTEELLRLLRLFAQHSIPVIPFKGPTLATWLYGDLTLRQFTDLDLIIHDDDFAKAKDALGSAGYYPPSKLPGGGATDIRRTHAYAFENVSSPVAVDLHWQLTPRHYLFSLEKLGLWERAQWKPFAGTMVLSPRPEDLLLLLCVHGGRHCWERLGWLCDIARLIHIHHDMDWHALLQRATKLGSRRMLSIGLLLVRDLLEYPLPEEVSQNLSADSATMGLTSWMRERLCSDSEQKLGYVESVLLHVKTCERLRDRIRYCAALPYFTPSSKDVSVYPLPTSLQRFYCFIRPIRLMSEHGVKNLWNYTRVLFRS